MMLLMTITVLSSEVMTRTEKWIIVTNVLIVLATLALTFVTGRDAQLTARQMLKAESRNTRLLARLLGKSKGNGGNHRADA